MVELRVMTEAKLATEALPRVGPEEGPLLAAAVTAALVEYRQHVKRHTGSGSGEGSGSNWRMVSRFEQLQGRG
jgi:hypothetical protein